MSNDLRMPLDVWVGELYERAARRRALSGAGWVLAIAAHAALAFGLVTRAASRPSVRLLPPVDVEFVAPPPAPTPAPREPAVQAKATVPARAAAPAAAHAGALHLSTPQAASTPQADEAVDFTTDPSGASYGGGVVAVSGAAALGVSGARPFGNSGTAPASSGTHPSGDGLTAASDLSRKPRLPSSDPCRGFFPNGAEDDEGVVALMVTIAKSGRVSATQLLSENPHGQGFAGAARTCMATQSFVPALDRSGNAAATAIRVNVRFSR